MDNEPELETEKRQTHAMNYPVNFENLLISAVSFKCTYKCNYRRNGEAALKWTPFNKYDCNAKTRLFLTSFLEIWGFTYKVRCGNDTGCLDAER